MALREAVASLTGFHGCFSEDGNILGRPLFHMDVKTHYSKSLSVFTSSSVLMSWNKVAVVSVGWSTGLTVN